MAGVYRFTNILNGRTYYGSAKEFKVRWKGHEKSLLAKKHSNKFLQSDFNKCGSEAFVFEVLEVVDGTKEDRLAREQIYLDMYHDNTRQCYNIRKLATSTHGVIHHAKKVYTDAMRFNMSEAQKGKKASEETKDKMSAAHTGRVVSEETRAKLSAAGKGKIISASQRQLLSDLNKGKKHTEATKQLCRLASFKRKIHNGGRPKAPTALPEVKTDLAPVLDPTTSTEPPRDSIAGTQ